MDMIPNSPNKPTQFNTSFWVILFSVVALVVIVLVWVVWRGGWMDSTSQTTGTTNVASSTVQNVSNSITAPKGTSAKVSSAVINSLTSPKGTPAKVSKSVLESLSSKK